MFFFNKLKKSCVLAGLVLFGTMGVAQSSVADEPHCYIQLQNQSSIHSVSASFTATPSDSIILEDFTDVNLKPGETSKAYGAHLYTTDLNSSYELTVTGDDGRVCRFTAVGHNYPTQSGDGCSGASSSLDPFGKTFVFRVADI